MASMAALVSAYAVSSARLACGWRSMASAKKPTPSIEGMRWSASSRATGLLRALSSRIVAAQVAFDGPQDFRIVIHREQDWFRHDLGMKFAGFSLLLSATLLLS